MATTIAHGLVEEGDGQKVVLPGCRPTMALTAVQLATPCIRLACRTFGLSQRCKRYRPIRTDDAMADTADELLHQWSRVDQ